jgi:hypothetical protein
MLGCLRLEATGIELHGPTLARLPTGLIRA